MKNKAGFLAYVATPVMTLVMYAIASTVFIVLFKDTATVSFFVILAVIYTINMSLFAVLRGRGKTIVRMVNLFLLTILLFGMASVLGRQNLQLEGLFFYALTGTFGGVIVHYSVGKILGPILSGRTWCSWGCWTAFILDLMPFKQSKGWKSGNKKKLKYLKYVHFLSSLVLIAVLIFVMNYSIIDPNQNPEQPGTIAALNWFLVGNAIYYIWGIAMAVIFKDNRAFCKYLCPVSVTLKGANLISLLRIKGDNNKCTDCGICSKNCSFDIDIPAYNKNDTRVLSTECTMCMKCISVCPEAALKSSVGLDVVKKELLIED